MSDYLSQYWSLSNKKAHNYAIDLKMGEMIAFQ